MSPAKQNLLREPARRTCLALADIIVGISDHTLDTFLARPRRPGRDVVHYYGVDPAPFLALKTDKQRFHREIGIGDDAPVLLFAGRMVPEKNPVFAVDILATLRRLDPRTVCVFAGSGSEEASVIARSKELGVDDATCFLGWRTDMPQILSYGDWFVLPRPEFPMEGFGLAVVEAQLAGQRMLLSRGVPDDPLLPSAVYARLSLAAGADAWAKAAIELLRAPAPSSQSAIEALSRSPMDMDYALADLMGLHG